MVERDAQVFHKRHLCTGLVVKGHHLIENRVVARFLDVCHCTEDKPAGIVVETAANVIVATLGEGLVLVIAATIGELCGSNIYDALTGTTGH